MGRASLQARTNDMLQPFRPAPVVCVGYSAGCTAFQLCQFWSLDCMKRSTCSDLERPPPRTLANCSSKLRPLLALLSRHPAGPEERALQTNGEAWSSQYWSSSLFDESLGLPKSLQPGRCRFIWRCPRAPPFPTWFSLLTCSCAASRPMPQELKDVLEELRGKRSRAPRAA